MWRRNVRPTAGMVRGTSVFHEIMAGLTGEKLLNLWLIAFVSAGLLAGIVTGFFRARKIQPNGFKWSIFRWEIFSLVITSLVSGTVLGGLNKYLTSHGLVAFAAGPAVWWVVVLEYAAGFFLFDTYFYWLHRWMHKE